MTKEELEKELERVARELEDITILFERYDDSIRFERRLNEITNKFYEIMLDYANKDDTEWCPYDCDEKPA